MGAKKKTLQPTAPIAKRKPATKLIRSKPVVVKSVRGKPRVKYDYFDLTMRIRLSQGFTTAAKVKKDVRAGIPRAAEDSLVKLTVTKVEK